MGSLPANIPRDLRQVGVMINGVFYPGFECYGIGVGSKPFVDHFLARKVTERKDVVKKSCELLESDRQALWTLLSCSITHKLGYHLDLQYPSDMIPVAKEVDNVLWDMLQQATGLHIPQKEEGRGIECVLDTSVMGLKGFSF